MNISDFKNRFEKIWLYIFITIFLSYTILLIQLASSITLFADDWAMTDSLSDNIFNLFTSRWGVHYRPIIKLSLYIDNFFSSGTPKVFHITNVILHAANALFIIFLYKSLFRPKNYTIPLLASLLFLVLPIHTDCIFWISARVDTVCAFFFFLTAVAFSYYLTTPSYFLFICSVFCFIGALLSKEMALSLPGVLFAIAWHKGVLAKKHTYIIFIFLLILYAVYFIIRINILGSILSSPANTKFSPSQIYNSLIFSFTSIFRSTDYKNIYSFLGMFTSLGIPALTIFIFLFSLKKNSLVKDIFCCLSIFLMTLIPVMGGPSQWHFYIPSAFACIILTRCWFQDGNNRIINNILASLFLLLIVYYGKILFNEGVYYQRITTLSNNTTESVSKRIKNDKKKYFLVNMPSVYVPENSMSWKPFFAYGFDIALRRHNKNLSESNPVIVNHLWLSEGIVTKPSIKKIALNKFLIKCDPPLFFSFHDLDFLSGKIQDSDTNLIYGWGQMYIKDKHELHLKIDTDEEYQIIFFDGYNWLVL